MGQPLHPPVSLPAPLSPSPPGTDPRPHSLTHSFISPPRLSPRPLPCDWLRRLHIVRSPPPASGAHPGRTWSGCAGAESPSSGAAPRQGAPPLPPPAPSAPGPAMAARGRGRGQMTFNVEAVGIGKGDALPPPTLQPSPLFPPLEHRAAPLPGGEEGEYMLALKQELRGAMKNLPYFVKPGAPRRDWRRLPRELKIRVRRLRKGRAAILIPKSKQRVVLDKEEAIKKLESLEKKEEEVTSEEEEEKEEEEEGKEEEEEEYDEEEHEEETDYIMSYFDNGEDFGGDSDDNMDEAVY
ncbi:DNA-directed RNA polymerase III subunit RPC7-like isoform X2 [Columba livia]|uniref:DNA-directed RNA polymerase III subunit RPC7-like isoform X2 n=1 Tax=Columba livia TaxID=8932 RepID=UPI0031BB66E9